MKLDKRIEGMVGAKVRMVSVKDGRKTTGFIQCYRDPVFVVLYDTMDLPPADGTNVIEGFRKGNLYSMVGEIRTLKHGYGAIQPNKAPQMEEVDFFGNFVRTPLVGTLSVGTTRSECTLIAMADRKFVADVRDEFEPNSIVEFTLTENGKQLVYEGLVESSAKKGGHFRSQIQILNAPRVTMMYWNKLLMAA